MVESILKNADANRSVAATKAKLSAHPGHTGLHPQAHRVNHITGERVRALSTWLTWQEVNAWSHSGATGERQGDAITSNRSLSSLGHVISALGQGKEGGYNPSTETARYVSLTPW